MHHLSPLIVLFISCYSFSQGYIDYHNACNEGAELIEQAHFQEAKTKLDFAIKSVEKPLAIDYFNLAKCYSQLNEKDSTLHYLELSLKTNFLTKKLCSLHYLWFEPILGSAKWHQLLDSNYYQYDEPISNEQRLLLKTIDTLLVLDQQYIKIQTDSISVYYPNDTILYNLYSDSIRMNQDFIQNSLDSIIEKYGWPGEKVNKQLTMSSLLLIHVTDEWFQKNNEILIEQIDLGNLHPWEYTDIADRKRHEHNLPVLYNGYFATKEEPTETIKENCKKIGAPLGKTRTIRAYYRMDSLD